MQKEDLVMFLEQKKRGVYNALVDEYWSVLSSTPTNLALILIANDLEKTTGKKVDLNYVSLSQALAKAKGKKAKGEKNMSSENVKKSDEKKWDFKDSHELKSEQENAPGKFKLD